MANSLPNMLQLKNIEKSFGSHHVFSIPDLELAPGIYWLKGANGSGKSTLLKLLAGLLPFKGDVILSQNTSITGQPVNYRRAVNYAPAEPIYPSFLSGEELLNYVDAVKQGDARQHEEVKEQLGIDHYLQNPTGSYSSGMVKKLSLLLAFTGRPLWILLDEPFTTLDQASQQALTGLIKQRHAQGISFLITSHHDIEAGELIFSRTFLLKDKALHAIDG
jgi:ABC-2 type transport system ATP-binding protein